MPGINSWDGPFGKFYKATLGLIAFLALGVTAIVMFADEPSDQAAPTEAQPERAPERSDSQVWVDDNWGEVNGALQISKQKMEAIAVSFEELLTADESGAVQDVRSALDEIAANLFDIELQVRRLERVASPPQGDGLAPEFSAAIQSLTELSVTIGEVETLSADAERAVRDPQDSDSETLQKVSDAVTDAYRQVDQLLRLLFSLRG